MEVDASEILEQMHSPPLGGTRDYQYLLRNYGTWTRRARRSTSLYESAPSMARSGSMGVMAGICAALLVFGMGMLLGAAFLSGEHKPAPQSQMDPEVTRRAEPAPQPETHVVPFSSVSEENIQSLPVAPVPAPVAKLVTSDKKGDKDSKPEAPFKRPNLAPGVIPKALPVEEPKTKAKH
jgi:hypothetical protein